VQVASAGEVPLDTVGQAERRRVDERGPGAATSSLLAAQCSGVSSCGPWNRASTSTPASTRVVTVAAPFA